MLHDKNEKGIQFGSLAARQSSFAQNGKSEGSDERQLYSLGYKVGKEIIDGVALLRFSYRDH